MPTPGRARRRPRPGRQDDVLGSVDPPTPAAGGPSGAPSADQRRPVHPKVPALVVIGVISLLIVGLAALSTVGTL